MRLAMRASSGIIAERCGKGVGLLALCTGAEVAVLYASAKMVRLFSITNCTARFFACMSVISRSMLRSNMMVGAKTTAKFLGVI